ncbi:MAG: proprotein convertase P-domain-containing protein, partial [Marinirhabdus sp.]
PVGTTTQTLEYVDAGGTAVQCSFNITVEDTEAPMVTCVGQPSTVVGTASASPGLPVDDSQGPVSSTITVNDDVEITDLDVDIDVTHTWVGDLTVQLTSPAGTTVTLFDVGCSANDLTFAFDDEGTGDLANCTAGTDSDAYPEASYVPSNPLAAFDGESTAGDWILTVEDTVGGDAGTFNAWGLNYSYLVPGVGITLQLDVNGEVTIPTMDLVDSATDNCGAVTVTAGGAANPCGESNPSDGFTNGGFSDNNPFIAANDFRVPADQDFILEMITANLIADPGATITGVEVRYYEDAGGLPGAQVGAAETVVPTSQTYVTSNFGFDSFETVLPITPMMFNGTPGSETVYWATLIVSSSTGGATGWEGSTTTFMGNDMASSGDNGATWTLTGNGGQDGVYNLAGTCQDIGATATMATFTCDDLGDNLVEVTATDAAGNTSTCLASVTVEDNVAPTLVCQDVTLSLDDNGMLEIEPSDVTMTAEDACGIDSIVTDAATYSCADIGMTFAVTVFAVDGNGNTSSCVAMVTVADTTGPVFDCPADMTVDTDDTTGVYIVEDFFASIDVTDNCTDPVTAFTQTPAPGTTLGVQDDVIVTLTATDDEGNATSCTFELDVIFLGVGDNGLAASIALYPNPASDRVVLSNPSNIELTSVSIYDMAGRLVQSVDLEGALSERSIDVSQLRAATYMFVINSEQGSVNKHIIKQ